MLSDVACIRKQIELECVSMVHASMFAVTTSHTIIAAKFEALNTLTSELAKHMTKEQAYQTTVETYDKAVEKAKKVTENDNQHS